MKARALAGIGISFGLIACGSSSDDKASMAIRAEALNPDTAPVVAVDRFSKTAGMLQVRDDTNGLPGPNAPVDFDQGPFITEGFGPTGQKVKYYNFDVQPTTPIPIYVFFEQDGTTPVPGQLNVIDLIPGTAGYSDFWRVVKVTVPSGYVANTVTSAHAIQDAKLPTATTDMLVNCPVVPKGSTAKLRLDGSDPALHRGWYQDQVVYYLDFEEAPLHVDGNGHVPLAPIYVTFNTNPPEGGPPTGFRTESGSMQTHNVASILPGDSGYSPLWSVAVYDNADFDKVTDLASVQTANILGTGVANVNCPIVSVQ